MTPTLHVLTPTYRPAGGVVKLMDYAGHALSAGYHVSVFCPDPWDADLPLMRIERLRNAFDGNETIRFHTEPRLDMRRNDYALVSYPPQFDVAVRALPRGSSPDRVIHLLQGVRHRTPAWLDGYPTRLLTRPAARISVNAVVGDAVAPLLDKRGVHEVIPLGHDLGYFQTTRSVPLHSPMRVAHTTWKSTVGDRVEKLMPQDTVEFRAIRDHVSWEELRELYHWADVFLCTPGPEEGFYMPGLEAMEAGCIVVTPNVGGNMAYCHPGENCLLVDFEDATSYQDALELVLRSSDELLGSLRENAHATASQFDLRDERRSFTEFLRRLEDRVEDYELSSSTDRASSSAV